MQNFRETINSTENIPDERAREITDPAFGKMEMTILEPQTYDYDNPLMIQPGWSADDKTFKSMGIEIAKLNTEVWMLNRPSGKPDPEKAKEKVPPELQEQFKEFKQIFLNALAMVEAILQEKKDGDFNKVDAIGHSQGAIDTVLAAQMAPDFFDKIILHAPGAVFKENPALLAYLKLVSRFNNFSNKFGLKALFDFDNRKVNWGVAKNLLSYLKDDFIKAMSEAYEISASNILPGLEELSKKGIKIVIAHPAGDTVFPMKKVQEAGIKVKGGKVAAEKGGSHAIGFVSLAGDHMEAISSSREILEKDEQGNLITDSVGLPTYDSRKINPSQLHAKLFREIFDSMDKVSAN